MTKLQKELIDYIFKNKTIVNIAKKINAGYADDLVQTLAEFILTNKDEKLPELEYFEKWSYKFFFFNINNGKLGKLVNRELLFEKIFDVIENKDNNENDNINFEINVNLLELFMFELPEKINRIFYKYFKYKNLTKVSYETILTYNKLIKIKNILKKFKTNK